MRQCRARAFQYRRLGNLAYIGNAAIFSINGWDSSGGILGMYLWRSLAESVSFRTRCMLAIDWAKIGLFGRGTCLFV